MSIKKKLKKMLQAQKQVEAESAPLPSQPEAVVPEVLEPVSANDPGQAMLELPPEHPLYRLYNQRRQEAGYLPAPRLCLDEEGVLPPETMRTELARLRAVITGACNARLKDSRNQLKPSKKKRKKGQEAPEEPQEKDKKQDDAPVALDALPFFFLSSDKLYAWVIVLPPMGGGRELTREMIYEALVAGGIGFGVDTHLADQLAHSDRRYFTLYLIAQGKPAFNGKNGNIVDNFPRVIERTLEVDEYDQVDYTALNLIHNVDRGQEICRLIKPTEGEPGRSVLDQEIPAKGGRDVPLPRGKNTEISEDGTQLVASIAGSVDFTGNVFQVKPVLEVPGDVDFSTGNINFLGDVNIRGNVLSGFTVRAMGNVRVEGVVEAGSSVEAGGDLVVVKGILGDGTTTVQCQRSVFSKYVENATISVRETLQTDCIIGSRVYCGGEVVVQSGRGSIMGGKVWAGRRVRANAVGSQSECKTSISLGGSPCASFEREMAHREVNDLEMEIERLACQPESPVRASLAAKAKLKLMTAEMKLRQIEEKAPIPVEDDGGEGGRLESAVVYPGTKVRIGDEVLRLRHVERRCVITMFHGEIVVM